MAAASERGYKRAVKASVSDVLATVPTWWEARARAAGLPREWHDWRTVLPEPPLRISATPIAALSGASPTELGDAYVWALDPKTRLREGRHYTPDVLARVLWAEVSAVAPSTGMVVDPACGAGALLVPALRAFVESTHEPAKALATVAQRFRGTDVDPVGVWLGNAILSAELLPLVSRTKLRRCLLPQLLHVADGLTCDADSPHVIVMNPPYGRVRLDERERLRWSETLYGHANRYAIFLQAAIELVAPGGVIAAVLPTSFLGGAYFQRLRTFISEQAPLQRVTFVGDRAGVFAGDVLQETCLAVFRKAAEPSPIRCAELSVNGSVVLTKLPSTFARAGSAPWLLPRHPHDRELVRVATRLTTRLSDYGWKVTTGPLVWNRHKAQIHARPGRSRLRIVWAADIDDGTVRPHPARDDQRWIQLRKRDGFMALTEPALLVQRTTAPEQPRRLIVGALDSRALEKWGGQVVVENHVNVLRCTARQTELGPALLGRLLQTPTLDRLYRCLTGSVAVSAYELEALPLPPRTVVSHWRRLSARQLGEAVAAYYGDAAS